MFAAHRPALVALLSLALGCSTIGESLPDAGGEPTVDAGVAGAVDAGTDRPDAAAPDAGYWPEVYPLDRTQSPITPFVADRLRAIAASGARQPDVFAKIGDSITVSTSFMRCFASDGAVLDGRDYLAPTIAHFLAGDAAGTNPFQRTSLSATVGWSAGAALAGDPAPLDQEIDAISPRFAVVMYGTNDIGLGNIDAYGSNLLDIADRLIAAGVVPLLTTVPPRDDSATADAEVPRYNLVVRGIAQGRQVPLIDYHRELVPLSDHGLGGDGVHPTTYNDGGARACVFTAAGLAYGYNVRNLVTIDALDRARRVVVAGEANPDAPARRVTGTGSPADPFVIDALPFTHIADTRSSPHSAVDVYDGCAATQDESGAEYTYRLELSAPTRVRAFVIDRGAVDIDVHLLDGAPTGAACLARAHRVVTAELDPGTYYFNLDSFVSGGSVLEGEYLFAVMVDP